MSILANIWNRNQKLCLYWERKWESNSQNLEYYINVIITVLTVVIPVGLVQNSYRLGHFIKMKSKTSAKPFSPHSIAPVYNVHRLTSSNTAVLVISIYTCALCIPYTFPAPLFDICCSIHLNALLCQDLKLRLNFGSSSVVLLNYLILCLMFSCLYLVLKEIDCEFKWKHISLFIYYVILNKVVVYHYIRRNIVLELSCSLLDIYF